MVRANKNLPACSTCKELLNHGDPCLLIQATEYNANARRMEPTSPSTVVCAICASKLGIVIKKVRVKRQ